MRTPYPSVVYIVDDDPDDRQLILDAFIEIDPTIDCVFIENGDQLMETLANTDAANYPSLILLDLNMPGMLGLHALKEIRSNKNYSQIPTIILTTSTFSQDESSSYKLGASCFIHKPQSYNELVEICSAIVKLWLKRKT